jgi:hypothetical protein
MRRSVLFVEKVVIETEIDSSVLDASHNRQINGDSSARWKANN